MLNLLRGGVIYSAKIINPKQITTDSNGIAEGEVGVIYSAKIINPKQITTRPSILSALMKV